MCKIISSEIVIGNFVIAAVEKNDFEFDLDKLYNFDIELSSKLMKQDYYTKFDPISVLDFQEDYPFFIKSINEKKVYINKLKNKEYLVNMLVRYFRIGIPKMVAQEMNEISKKILEC